MTYKKWMLAALAATVAVSGAFASGNSDSDNYDRGNDRRGGRNDSADGQADMEERRAEMLEEAETYEGTFTMVDGEYPALVDADGTLWYLMVRGFESEENIPAEGAEIQVEAVIGGMSPVHLMVLEAVVDGEVLEADYSEHGKRGGPGGNRPQGGPGQARG